jgi:hypothetical protein
MRSMIFGRLVVAEPHLALGLETETSSLRATRSMAWSQTGSSSSSHAGAALARVARLEDRVVVDGLALLLQEAALA